MLYLIEANKYMRIALQYIVIATSLIHCNEAFTQALTIPEGSRSRWVINNAEEIVQYLTFDPATVESSLPDNLRFITLKELADNNIEWAADYLSSHPSNSNWGVSFLEIVRMQTFTIDGLEPNWPEDGAVALWCARVTSSDSAVKLGPGQLLLVLDFWVPDSTYVVYMQNKGHYATYGEIELFQDSDQTWHGSIRTDKFTAEMLCKPSGPVFGGSGSRGEQTLFPPAYSLLSDVIRVAFAGHREQECDSDSSWRFQGDHPLVQGIPVGSSIYEFGYNLIGGAYLH